MPYNGSGTFTPYTPGNPVVNGTVIDPTAFNATQNDIAAGLTNAVTRDGQSPPSANLPMAGKKLTGLAAGVMAGDTLRWEQLFSQGIEQDIASAATTDIGSLNTTNIRITGTTTITSFGANYNGPRFIRFAGALLLTHNATALILPGGANITTAAGDCLVVVPNGSTPNGWRVVAYQVASLVPGTATSAASAGTLSGTVAIANGGTGQTTAAAAFNALKQAATDTASGAVELATAAEFNTGTDPDRVPSARTIRDNQTVLGPATTLTNQTLVDFTSPGTWVQEFEIRFAGMSTNGINGFLLQLSDSGGPEAAGYNGTVVILQNAAAVQVANLSTFVGLGAGVASNSYHGSIRFGRVDGNTWYFSGKLSLSGTTVEYSFVGSKTLSSALTGCRLSAGGGDQFDAGSVTPAWG